MKHKQCHSLVSYKTATTAATASKPPAPNPSLLAAPVNTAGELVPVRDAVVVVLSEEGTLMLAVGLPLVMLAELPDPAM